MATETQLKILDAAHELVLQRGLPATTVDEICETAGASKGSFYHFFRTKEEMGLALLARYYEGAQQRLFEAPWTAQQDPTQRLLGFLTHAEESADAFWGDGCLLGSLATDVAQTNPVMQERISLIFGSLAQRLAPVFEPAVVEGGPGAVELAEQWLSIVEGAIVLARGHRDPGRIANGLAVFRDHIGRLLEDQQLV